MDRGYYQKQHLSIYYFTSSYYSSMFDARDLFLFFKLFFSVVFRAEIPKFDGIIPAEFRVFFLPPKFYGIGIIPSKIKNSVDPKYRS